MKITKWYNTAIYVDIETGEIIAKNVALKEYYIVNKTKKIKLHENYGIREFINECRNKNQTRLW